MWSRSEKSHRNYNVAVAFANRQAESEASERGIEVWQNHTCHPTPLPYWCKVGTNCTFFCSVSVLETRMHSHAKISRNLWLESLFWHFYLVFSCTIIIIGRYWFIICELFVQWDVQCINLSLSLSLEIKLFQLSFVAENCVLRGFCRC